MGLHSRCTADTKKSISAGMNGYEGAPKKVYLLNPFGEPYVESHYFGYGVFGGQDMYVLAAKWNAPELCKDKNGDWLSKDEIRDIGIDLAHESNDHVQLTYPIKIVENLCAYEDAGISPKCPHQGHFYGSPSEIQERIDKVFRELAWAQKGYELFLECKGDADGILKRLNFEASKGTMDCFIHITAKRPDTPEAVMIEIARKGSEEHLYSLLKNPSLTKKVLNVLEQRELDVYLQRRVQRHPNYEVRRTSLADKILNAKGNLEAVKGVVSHEQESRGR